MNTLTLTLEATPENLRKICDFFGTSEISKDINKADVPDAETTAPEVMPVTQEPETEKPVTKAEVRAKAIEITKAGKQAELKAILNDFGASKLSEIKEADFSEVYKKLSEVA